MSATFRKNLATNFCGASTGGRSRPPSFEESSNEPPPTARFSRAFSDFVSKAGAR